MKFLLDVCASSRVLDAFLVGRGDDVVSVVSLDPKASDEHIMNVALGENRVLITEDKDFGELIFVRRLPHGPIVRLVELTNRSRRWANCLINGRANSRDG